MIFLKKLSVKLKYIVLSNQGKKYSKVLKQLVLIHTITGTLDINAWNSIQTINSSVANDFRSTGYIALTIYQLKFWLQECSSSNSNLKHVDI